MRKIYTLLGCLFLFQVSNNASAQVIFSENFSSATGTTPPTGWTNDEILAGGGLWAFDNPGERIANLPLSAPFAVFDSDYLGTDGSAEETALESPTFDATIYTGGYIFLIFDHYFRDEAGGEYYVEVYDGTTWVSVLDGTGPVTNSEHVVLDITSVVATATDAQVRFRWVGDYSWYWIVDNVSVGHYNCLAVDTLAIGNETPNSLDATWTAGASETSWNVEWGTPGFTPGTGTEIGSDAVTTESITINGLNPGTDYDVYV
ncbi:fibronectin type III domain-containing protein, partial [Fluviicola sp.]|uniref:fibronectin type III domain-containing protein n=1 Tax=Fluviicola sp. TaxID=1917219 RepID=UPI0026016F12